MLRVITFGDNMLSQRSIEISKIDDETVQLSKEMFKTLYFSNGIGLAAVQVGVLKRLIIMDVPKFDKYTMINPKIISISEDKCIFEEGCLSVPGIASEIERSKNITVEYLDIDNNNKRLYASGLLATCIQHEIDHLNGILFIDRLLPEDRLNKIKEYTNLHIV